jgi:hypothetical protein
MSDYLIEAATKEKWAERALRAEANAMKASNAALLEKRRADEAKAKLAKAVEHIEWFISEDETNRGDEPMSSHGGRTWDEINEYWITHLDSAVAFVAELKGETDA